MGRTKKENNAVNTTTTEMTANLVAVSAGHKARFDELFINRHYTKTTETELWATIIGAGLKAIEKRRVKTAKSKIEKAEAVLRAAGRM